MSDRQDVDLKAMLRSVHRSVDPLTTLDSLLSNSGNLDKQLRRLVAHVEYGTATDPFREDVENIQSSPPLDPISAKARFLWVATAVSHIFYHQKRLCKKTVILPYRAPNVKAPYIWFKLNENGDDEHVELVKHILPGEGYFRLKVTVDGYTQMNSYVLSSGIRMKCVKGVTLDIEIDFPSQTVRLLKANPEFPNCVILFTIENSIVGLFLNTGSEVHRMTYCVH